MNREILKHPNPLLKKRSQEVGEISPELLDLAKDMAETMKNSQGIGLAAPQIGILKRVIVVDPGDGVRVFFNPKITKKGRKKEVMEEGCLSLPGYSLKISRPIEIDLEFIDEKGQKKEIKADGMLARIIQHETDHLDGTLLLDRINLWRRIWA